LADVAASGSREVVGVLLASERVRKSPILREALRSNPQLRANEMDAITQTTEPVEIPEPAARAAGDGDAEVAARPAVAGDHETIPTPEEAKSPESSDEGVLAEAIAHYIKENEAELAGDLHQPFQPIGGIHEAGSSAEAEAQAPPQAVTAQSESQVGKPVAVATTKTKRPVHDQEEKRDSTLQKIAKLDVKGRIALAIRGSKEDRSILIRDGTKLVALAVLDSPKVSDGEVENFAQQKNVLEAVLRAIPLKRRFAKNYAVVRNLVFNPRTPLDLSLGLMKNLLIHDLKNLSANKEVADTIRKLALRMFKQKMEKKG